MLTKKDKYLSAAQKLAERGQLEKALLELAKVVQDDPKDTRTWLKMAELHARRGANQEAAEIYARTGDLYAEQGFAQKAVAVYKNVLKLSPTSVAVHRKLGAIFRQLELTADAVQQFELAAVGFQQVGEFAEAVASLRQAVELQPDNVVLRVNLAESASQANFTDEAVQQFGIAADALEASGRMDEYVRVCERLLFHRPEHPTRARQLAAVYIERGSARLALPKLQVCLNADPRAPETLSLLAKALEQLGQTAKAISVMKELIRAYGEAGRAVEREATIAHVLALDPGERDALANQYPSRVPSTIADSSAADSWAATAAREVGERLGPAAVGLDVDDADGRQTSDDSTAIPTALDFGIEGDASARARAGGAQSAQAPGITRILAETEVFMKYELFERAAINVARVFELDPRHRGARETLISVLTSLERFEDAARERQVLEQQLAEGLVKRSPGTGSVGGTTTSQKDGRLDVLDVASADDAAARGWPTGDTETNSTVEPSRVGDEGEGDPRLDMQTPPVIELTSGPSILAVEDVDHDGDIVTPPPKTYEATDQATEHASSDAAPGGSGSTSLPESEADDVVEIAFDLESGSYSVEPEASSAPGRAPSPAAATPPAELENEVTPPLAPAPEPATRPRFFAVDDDIAGAFGRLEATADGSQARMAERDDATVIDRQNLLLADLISRAETTSRSEETVRSMPAALAPPEPVDEAELESELELASFFIDQGMFDDVDVLLAELDTQFRGHSRLVEMHEELAVARHLVVGASPAGQPGEDDIATAELDSDDPADPGQGLMRLGHYDAAIEEYKRLARVPAREVFALTKMGDCFQGKGTFTEAILRYKRALNCDEVSRDEARLLYYQLGRCFERLGDVSEALYFFEKVAKRAPEFKDVTRRISDLLRKKEAPGKAKGGLSTQTNKKANRA